MTNATKISQQPVCLEPKPPPMRGLMTCTCDCGMSSDCATMRRTWKGTCVEVVTEIRPNASVVAKARKVSMGAVCVAWLV